MSEENYKVPAILLSLENGCGVVCAWIALRRFGKRIASAKIATQCRYRRSRGTFAIAIAVALRRHGLPISFHSDKDEDKQAIEISAYRAAEKLGIPVMPALSLREMRAKVDDGKLVILLFDTKGGDGHFSPVLSIGERAIFFSHSEEPKLSLRLFESRWSAPGICRQAIVVA